MEAKIFAVYKPKGPTSNDILNKLRRFYGTRKVGHAGTLDPLAKGILVVAVGREATKKLGELVKKEKEYLATIRLGIESATDDAEGTKTKFDVRKKPTKEEIKIALKKFEGKISQIPPIFSAVKIQGKEAYKYARKGQEVTLKPRKVEIKKIKILKYYWPYLKLKVVTGPGVYIRSLARDLGKKLKIGGYLFNLERTRVGDFTKAKSKRLP
ncbi:MAG: tRNA pseudouridine(55) synthase TruB [Patescibacteria group bacterium]